MADADMAVEPWSRLASLAPPLTDGAALQTAANRYVANNDLYSAAADLWETYANSFDLTPPAEPTQGALESVTQDGISVKYAHIDTSLAYNQRVAQRGLAIAQAAKYRKRSKPTTVLIATGDFFDASCLEQDENGIIGVVNWP